MSESFSQNDLDALIQKETEAIRNAASGDIELPEGKQSEVIRNKPDKTIRPIQFPVLRRKSDNQEEFLEELLEKPFSPDQDLKNPQTDYAKTTDKKHDELMHHLDDLDALIKKETQTASPEKPVKIKHPPKKEIEDTLHKILHPVDTIDEKRKQLEERMRHMTLHQQRRDYKKQMVAVKRAGFLSKLVLLPLIIFAAVFLLQQPFWDITDISDTRLHNSEVLTIKNLNPLLQAQIQGKPLYFVNPQDLSDSIKQHFPIVDDVVVRRYLFPTRVELTITEKPIYGELYKTRFKPNGKEAPYALLSYHHDIVPLALYKYQPGKTLSRSDVSKIYLHSDIQLTESFLSKFRKLAYQLNHLNGFTLKSISLYPSPKDKDNAMIEADFEEGKVLLGQMDTEIFLRLERLLPLRDTLVKNKDTLRWVDLRWGEQITLRKK